MNRFLQLMEITFRRDPYNFRPRINKYKSVKDRLQKQAGNFFLMDEGDAQRTGAGKKNDDDDEDEFDQEETKSAPA